MPDIDVDFCVRGREAVIDYVSELYGRQNVAQIITFGTMASRAVIKDVGRAMNLPFAEVEKVAKMIPPPVRGRNVPIDEAIKQSEDLKRYIDSDEKIAELIDTARRLEGSARHSSVHAAGVVISPVPIYDLVPVCRGQNDQMTTQFVMSDLEKTGLLKMDFLALTTLTIIEDCLRSIERERGERPDLAHIPLDDAQALQLFADGHLNAVFQFESAGMVEICRKLRPEGLEDLSALNALYRPGPIDGGMIDDYIDRRHGHRRVSYIVPQMKSILENTYGILVYQEQIMLLAQHLAGYSLGEADLMRRAMGKKKQEEMAKHEEKFVKGAIARSIPEAKARSIFELMRKFADYGFNRSHSFAYAYLAYQTAYLKAHYPTHFYSAVLSNEIANTEKLARYINEMKVFSIDLLPPDVNTSEEGFTPVGGAIRFGLAAIKGVGATAVESILEARAAGGPFKSLFDLAERVDQRSLNRRVFESLIKAGACDSLSGHRAQLVAAIDRVSEAGARAQRDRRSGQGGLFGEQAVVAPPLPDVAPWGRRELLAHEKEALGFYASGHPLSDYAAKLRGVVNADTNSLSDRPAGSSIALGGIILDLASRLTKKNDRFALFNLEDQYGKVKVVCWPDCWAKHRAMLEEGRAVVVRGRLETSDESAPSIIAQDIAALEKAHLGAVRLVRVRCREADCTERELEHLGKLLAQGSGQVQVVVELLTKDGLRVRLRPNRMLRIELDEALAEALSKINERWEIEYETGG